MKKTVCIVLSVVLLNGCGISSSEHNKVTSERDSLELLVSKLESEIDELENGEERLIGLIEYSYNSEKFLDTQKYIERLLEKHPETLIREYFTDLLLKIDEKAKAELAVIDQARKDSIRLANIDNLGIWEINYFVDEFGDRTSSGYITTKRPIYGTFSNSATQGSDLRVEFIIINNKKIAIQLYEYNGSNPVKDYNGRYIVSIQDSGGEKHILYATNYDSDRLSFGNNTFSMVTYEERDKTDSQIMYDILMKGGEIKFNIVDKERKTTKYNFSISNFDWFENAMFKLSHTNS